ncbi:MAG: hypothetical protein LBB63_00190 [Holosporaceae bacterium]|jgi:HemY protein|nr:hypothetical protein [Holosporaceae bacterium]
MRGFCAFLKFLAFIALLLAAVRYGGSVSLGEGSGSVSIHIAAVVFACGLLTCFWSAVCLLLRCLSDAFRGKSSHEKGLENLQRAFSSMLLRDHVSAATFIRKARKYLGDIPMISWLNGQVSLTSGDGHRAKSIFYALSEREEGTVFGAQGLLQLAIREKSDNDALNAINAILEVASGSQDLVAQAVAVALRNKNYPMAKKHLASVEKSDKKRLMEAVICSEEGAATGDIDLVRRAFRLAPQLSRNAIFYSALLMKEREYRKARKILRKSFGKQPLPEVFDRCLSGGNTTAADRMKLAGKLVSEAPESWVGYYGMAKLAIQEDMLPLAFKNLQTAYGKEQYDFIAHELTKVAGRLEEPKPPTAAAILANPPKSRAVTFVWKCADCGAEEKEWVPVCDHCNRIAEHRWTAIAAGDSQLVAVNNGEDFY